ncbi:MAG TPA: DUF222 domain-containing protein [Jiangellales bacterium]|nr:DUF222 domain-containing protein [Jiangellales bacterium]
MFQADVPEDALGGGFRSGSNAPAWSGDLFPLVPGAPDAVGSACVLAEYQAGDDPWLEEFAESGWIGPAPEEELQASLFHARRLNGKGGEQRDDDGTGGELRDDDGQGVPLEADAEVAAPTAAPVALVRHPGARVPARMPSVEELAGGAQLATVLAGAQVAELGAYELVEFIAGCERVAAAMHALQASGIAELARRVEMRPVDGARVSMSPQRVTALEVAARLAVSSIESEAMVARAEYLQRVLPTTFVAWAEGRLDTRKAEVIARKLWPHEDELAREVESLVLPKAPELTVESLRRLINREILRLAPKDAQARHEDAKQRRHITITPVGDGMSWIEGYVPDEVAAAVKATLDAGAAWLKQEHPDDGRTMGARRVDVLAALAFAAIAAGRIGGCSACGGGIKLASAQHRPVAVNVTVPASSLLGLDEQPGELAGFGPITAATARRLAKGGVWRRVLTDAASGTVLDVGRTRYRPPAPLAEHILLRDVRCVWPGCDRTASAAGVDIDHVVDWALGGKTADHNLGSFCEKHHVDKHSSRWRVSQPEPGRFEYTSPTGHTYIREPEPVGPAGDRATPVVGSDPDPPPVLDMGV